MKSYDRMLGMLHFHKVKHNRNSVHCNTDQREKPWLKKISLEMIDKFPLRIRPLGSSIVLCKTTDDVRKQGTLNPTLQLPPTTYTFYSRYIETESAHIALESSHSGWFHALCVIQHATTGWKQLIFDTLSAT